MNWSGVEAVAGVLDRIGWKHKVDTQCIVFYILSNGLICSTDYIMNISQTHPGNCIMQNLFYKSSTETNTVQ